MNSNVYIAIFGAAFVQVTAFAVGWGRMQQKMKDMDSELKFIKRYLFNGNNTNEGKGG